MILKLFNIKTTIDDSGKISLYNGFKLKWEQLTANMVPKLPSGTEIVFSLSINDDDILNGKNGIVWATSHKMQAEIIHNALMAQHIDSKILKLQKEHESLYFLMISNSKEIEEVINYIWKADNGLRLKPDWFYPEGEPNKSFEKWLNG